MNRVMQVLLTGNAAGLKSTLVSAARDVKAFESTVGGSNRRVAASSSAARAGILGLATAGGALALGYGLAVSKAMQFDKAMSAAASATQVSGRELETLRKAAMRAGADSQYSASEAAAAITEMGKAGVGTADILGGGLRGSLALAAAGQIEVAEAAEFSSIAMTQFNLSGRDLPHVADLLAAGAGKAMGSVGDLGAALKQSGLIASAAGMSIEETTATLSAFASAGLIGSDAGTSLKTMLQMLQAPTNQSSQLMKQLGIDVYDANGDMVGMAEIAGELRTGMAGLTQEQRNAAFATIFGADAVRGANVLYKEGAAGVENWTNKVNDQGYAAKTAAELTDNLSGDLERLGGAFDTLLITMGQGAQGPLRSLVQGLTGLVEVGTNVLEFWLDLPGPVQAGVIAFGAFLALRGPLSSLFETIALKSMYMRDAVAGASMSMGGFRAAGAGLVGALGGPWGLALTGATIGLTALVGWLGQSDEATDRAKTATEGYAAALNTASGAIDQNVRKAAAKAAQDAGLLDVADRAGIGLDRVTDAITNQGGALDSVRDKLVTYIEDNTHRVQSDQGVIVSLSAEAEAAQEALAALDLLAGQAPESAEAQAQIDAAVGSTTEAMAASEAQTEAARVAQEEWLKTVGEALAGFVDPLTVYQGLLADKTESERVQAEETAAATADATDSWEDYVGDVSVSLDEYADKLAEKIENQKNWRENIVKVTGWAGMEVGQILLDMGEEGVQIAADMADGTHAEAKRMAQLLIEDHRAGGAGSVKAMDDAMKAMAIVARDGANATRSGIARELGISVTEVQKIADAYGVALATGINPVLAGIGKKVITINQQAGRRYLGVQKYDTGGYTGPGGRLEPAGLVHRGEVVWSQADVNAWGGPVAVDEMRKLRGYAEGGIVELGRRFQQMGARVGEHPAFGGVAPVHTTNSMHYQGLAIDVNTRAGTSSLEQRELAPMRDLAQRLGFRTIFMAPGHYGHLHVDTGGSRSIGATAAQFLPTLPAVPRFPYNGIMKSADKWAQAANEQAQAFLNAQAAKMQIGLPTGPGGGSGPVQSQVQAVAARYGWGSGAQWNALSQLIQGESSWNPSAANPTSSARGLFQKMTSLHGPVESTAAGQAEWGLRYIQQAYGSPAQAYAKWASRSPHWYDEGGLAYGSGSMRKKTIEPERVLSPRQTAAFEEWMKSPAAQRGYGAAGSGGEHRVVVKIQPGDLSGMQITGTMDLGGGLEARIDGRIAASDANVGRNVRSAFG